MPCAATMRVRNFETLEELENLAHWEETQRLVYARARKDTSAETWSGVYVGPGPRCGGIVVGRVDTSRRGEAALVLLFG